jgi:hypothetical protein
MDEQTAGKVVLRLEQRKVCFVRGMFVGAWLVLSIPLSMSFVKACKTRIWDDAPPVDHRFGR